MKRLNIYPILVILALGSPAAFAQVQEPLPLSGPAFQLADEAYKAYEQGNYSVAVEKAREAVRLRPDVARLKTLLNQSLAAQRNARMPGKSRAVAPVAREAAGPGYHQAEAAYRQFGQQKYRQAALLAQQAVQVAPGVRSYRLLLIESLVAAGDDREAEMALTQALGRFPGDRALLEKRSELQRRASYRLQEKAYAAMERGDRAGAIEAARSAIAITPEALPIRLLLASALASDSRLAEALTILDAATDRQNLSSVIGWRAYLHQLLGDAKWAEAEFDKALASSATQEERRALQIIAVDAALASRDLDIAQRRLDGLQDRVDQDAALRRNALAQMKRVPAPYRSHLPMPFSFPVTDCSRTGRKGACMILPGGAARDPAYATADEAYAAFGRKDYALAAAKAEKAIGISPYNAAYRQLLVEALTAGRQYLEAEQALSDMMAVFGTDGPSLVERGQLRLKLAKRLEGKSDLAEGLELGGLTLSLEIQALSALDRKLEAQALLKQEMDNGGFSRASEVEIAYLAVQTGDDAASHAAFVRADEKGELPDASLTDAAYAAMRMSQDGQSVDYFRRAIDANESMKLRMEPELLFSTRRSVAEVTREWGVLSSINYGNGSAASVSGLQNTPSAQSIAQLGVEAYWRPFGYRNGKYVEVFGRMFETLHSDIDDPEDGGNGKDGPTGADSRQAYLGLRWKPLTDENFILSMSRLVKLGDAARNDWLAQAAYSYGVGTDLAPVATSWFTGQFYTEAGRYLQNDENYALASLQLGRSFKVGGSQSNAVVFPHVSVATDYNSKLDVHSASGAGLGVNFRYWYRGDKYAAPRSYIDFLLQRRVRIGGDGRADGWFFSILNSY